MNPHSYSRIFIHSGEEEADELLIPHGEALVGTETFAASLEWPENSLALLVEETDGAPFAMSLCWDFEGWSKEVYVFLPAGAYAGNRFPSLPLPYSPRLPEELVRGTQTSPLITDVPRLSCEPGPTRLQLCSGDLACPAFGWFDARSGKAWLALAKQPEGASDWLWEIEESESRDSATFRVSAPALRDSPVYLMPMMRRPSPDVLPPSAVGETRRPDLECIAWDCPDLPAFFDEVFTRRAAFTLGQPKPAVLPFSESFAIIEEHYNRDSWREDLGIYATDCAEGSAYPFQPAGAAG